VTLIPRPSHAHDLMTMAEVDSGRFTSLGRVTTGVGSISRGAETKLNSLGKSSRPSWYIGIHDLLSNTRDLPLEIPKYSGAVHCTANTMFTTMQCKMHVTKRLRVAREEAKQSRFLQLSSTELFSNRRNSSSAQSKGARRRELSTPQGGFREGYRKIPHETM